jgi:hypothetical protein
MSSRNIKMQNRRRRLQVQDTKDAQQVSIMIEQLKELDARARQYSAADDDLFCNVAGSISVAIDGIMRTLRDYPEVVDALQKMDEGR